MQTLDTLADALAHGQVTSRQLVDDSLARITDPAGEGPRTFLRVYAEQARAQADGIDALRRLGRAPSRYAGIPISIKDLCDVAGEVTTAGSRVLADAAPAAATATAVERLLAAGLIPLGRTNMTEFAFSGLGINPHYGTPRGPWDRATGRIPGGSSSGAAVSVRDGMVFGALGTDTGGSCRVPAAMCGITGYKPTARRVPLTGILPLAPSLDSVGPLANSVACCAILDAIMAGQPPRGPEPLPLAGLRLGVPLNVVLDQLDQTVGSTFQRLLARFAELGAQIMPLAFPALSEIATANARGGFAAAEAFAWHRSLLASRAAEYDPRIRVRIARGETQLAADYIDLVHARAAIVGRMNEQTAPFDALVMPTCPIVPPSIGELEREEAQYNRINLLLLRNCAVANFLDRCAISLPVRVAGDVPVGLMLMGETMGDAKLFRIAAAVEAALAA